MWLIAILTFVTLTSEDCDGHHAPRNTSALDEQAHTEINQRTLLENQPLPTIPWSMERDNLIKLKKLQNDRTVNFFMYVFIEGIQQPIGYYQVNKVSSVNSQLSNPQQIISGASSTNNLPAGAVAVIESPSEDGSYGTNGDAVFGFTPEDICIETNMKFICATVPLHFQNPVNRLAIITTDEAKQMLEHSKTAMNKK
jgi:hypothetical protein